MKILLYLLMLGSNRMNILRCHALLIFASVFLVMTSVAEPMPVKSVERSQDGMTLHLASGTLKLQMCAERVIRVSYSPGEVIPAQTDFVVIKKWTPCPFTFKEDEASLTLSTDALGVRVDRASGALTFSDAAGRTILRETPEGGKKMTPALVNDETTFHSEQSFVSPLDEFLYGMAQAQDAVWNWRGMPIELRQLNTQAALPVLVSSKGWGLLWNNASFTDFNPVDEEVPLTLEGPATTADANGPTATEQIVTAGGKKNPPVAVRTGDFTSGAEGEYVFFAKDGDRKKIFAIEVDGQRIGGVENFWVPYTTTGKMHLPAGKTCHVKLIGGGEKARLYARPLGDRTTFRSQVGDTIDYYVFYGPKLDDVVAGVRMATGTAPMWPKWAFGFWQCRERYSSQQQILDTVAEFRKRGIPLDLIVQDWQYWGTHGWGAYQWDERSYPDPKAMIDSLHAGNTKFMISAWSNPSGPVHDKLAAKGLLIKGKWVDAFAAEAREIRWKYLDAAFFKMGTDGLWQDATEPGDDGDAVDGARTAMGSGNRLRNAYPLFANQTVYEGQRAAGSDKRVVTLTRSSFPGQQRYAAALWSGDIGSTWDAFRRQIPAGLNTCLTGLPYWTTDCGGFFRPKDQYASNDFNELLGRWFQWSTFLPILRIHGYQTETEMWKYPKAYETLVKYDRLRYRLLPYNYSLAWQVTDRGYTFTRALPMDFPEDQRARSISDQYMHGPAFLVSPVTTPGAVSRTGLSAGRGWVDRLLDRQNRNGRTGDHRRRAAGHDPAVPPRRVDCAARTRRRNTRWNPPPAPSNCESAAGQMARSRSTTMKETIITTRKAASPRSRSAGTRNHKLWKSARGMAHIRAWR